MNPKVKNIIRKIIYLVLFALVIFCFIYLSDKYSSLSERKVMNFNDYYKDINGNDIYTVVRANQLITDLQKGKHLIFIGDSKSKWSIKYAEELTKVFSLKKIDTVDYYDLASDRNQMNSNYYEIMDLLESYLTTVDGNNNMLLAPSFYIIIDGKVKYYNTDTVAMRNTISENDYWTTEKQEEFLNEINTAINKYYLNN